VSARSAYRGRVNENHIEKAAIALHFRSCLAWLDTHFRQEIGIMIDRQPSFLTSVILRNTKLTALLLSRYLTNGFNLITPRPKPSMNRQHYKETSRKQRLPLKSPTSAPSGRQLNKHFSKQLLSQIPSLSLYESPLIHVVASVSLK
jgi:hypothetical protein